VPVSYAALLRETLPRVRESIADAARAAGRDPVEVRLIAVTKGHPLDAVRAALDCGLADLGENRVEELAEKVAAAGRSGVRWHMIGHVQSRKAKDAAALADLVHSVDSVKLAERLGRAAVESGRELEILVQVNTSGEGSKSGLGRRRRRPRRGRRRRHPPDRLRARAARARAHDDGAVHGRRARAGRYLRRAPRAAGAGAVADGPDRRGAFDGMTNDLAVAVREGSTMVRIGTALFGDRR
jgi:uncharacterized pyridoxal phosphate-containing UPF0001 family protein